MAGHPPGQPADLEGLIERAQEAERREIARQLHDTVIQPLMSLVMSMGGRERQLASSTPGEAHIELWQALAQEALDALRSALAGLPAHPRGRFDLPEALHGVIVPEMRGHGISVSLECLDWPDDAPPDWSFQLYLVVREALTNVWKHAQATEVTLLLRAEGDRLRILIADNGVGFSRSSLTAPRRSPLGSGLGISGMRERVRMLGGHLRIATHRGRGARIEIRLPRPAPLPTGEQGAASAWPSNQTPAADPPHEQEARPMPTIH